MENPVVTISVTLPGRLQQLLTTSLAAFNQSDLQLLARPMGVDIESCQLASKVGHNLLNGKAEQLTISELKALIMLLTFAERELATEFHITMQELQKKMAEIVISRNSKEIDRLAEELPKEAERAKRVLRSVVKNRGQLLDECQSFIKKLTNQLELAKL